MSKLEVDLDLIRKYNVPGPRYTSYPPATHFTDAIEKEALVENIRKNNETDRDLSLYFHLPFCESLCWFCGCTTVITKDHGQSNPYLDRIEKELSTMSNLMNRERKVVQVHLGGGTPTFLTPSELLRLGEMVRSTFLVSEEVEAGVEIDPRHFNEEKARALKEAGFNRASMGVQDNNPEVQKAVHRIQPLDMTRTAVNLLREHDFKSLNIDLIYGLPHQTVSSFEKTLDEILELQPDRFAVFSYAHVPWIKPAQKILQDKILPSAEVKLELLKLTIEKLTSEGYVYIGMDHFAKADDELAVAQRHKTLQRNFQGYSTLGGVDIYAFGMSAISQAGDGYWQNQKTLEDYFREVDSDNFPMSRGYLMTEEDKLRRTTIMRLMCDLELNFSNMSELLGVDFEEHFRDELESFEDLMSDGLVARTEKGLTVTDIGRLLIRNIAMRFDACLTMQMQEGRYSRTI